MTEVVTPKPPPTFPGRRQLIVWQQLAEAPGESFMVVEAAMRWDSIGLARSIPARGDEPPGKAGTGNASGLRTPLLTQIRRRRKLRTSGELELASDARRKEKAALLVLNGANARVERLSRYQSSSFPGEFSWQE